MSKSTKIIAGLGVAAALGVAALPVASFAVSQDYTGRVTLSATIADEIAITIDGTAMSEGATPAAGTSVTFMNAEATPTANLSAGSFYKAGATQIAISTNVPNTYTLKVNGTALTSADASIPVAGTTAANALTPTGDVNGEAYTGASMWGIKISGVDKTSAPISMTTDGTTASIFQGATAYMVGTADTIVDYAAVTSGKIENTYTATYGLGINSEQSSGTYTGEANYTVTHVQGS